MNGFLGTKIRLSGILEAVAFLAVIGTIASFLGRYAWWLDLASHFRVQYVIVFTVSALVLTLARRRRLASGSLALAAVNLALIAPLYFPPGNEPTSLGPTYRAMLINVNTERGNPDAVLRAIREEKPDVLVLEEINDQWMQHLAAVRAEYPYWKTEVREDNFGIGLLSRLPWDKARIIFVGSAGVPSVVAVIPFGGRPVTVFGTHPLPPGGPNYSYWRNEQLARIPAFLRRTEGPVLLLGDLNVSPWCHYFRRLLRETGLKDSSRGRGVQPTWPTFAWPFLIPIDHCLHSDGIVITRKRVGRSVGSDHYPVIVDFAVVGDGRLAP